MNRKFIKVRNETTSVKMQLDTSSDIVIINEKTEQQIAKLKLYKSNKVAYCVTGKKLYFFHK